MDHQKSRDGGGGVFLFQWMNFFYSTLSACIFFFFDVEALLDFFFFFDRTSFNVKGMQSFPQFNYCTAQGDSLFNVEIRVPRVLRKK